MKKLLFIINLHSGKGQIKQFLADIIDRFVKTGYEVTVQTTQAREDATRLARERGEAFDLLVCSGGDGTLSEVLDGIMVLPEEKRPKIGYIPAGSTNDYAFSIGLPKGMRECAEVIASGHFRRVDVGRFQHSMYFVYVAAFGAFTEISWNTPQEEKNALGHNAYILEGIKQFNGLKSYPVSFVLDGKRIESECVYAMVYNAISVGGFKNIGGADVKLNDGKLNMMIVHTPANPLEFASLIADLLTMNPSSNFIDTYEVESVRVESEEGIEWVLDGEYGGSHKVVEIEAVRQGMEIAIPDDRQAKQFTQEELLEEENEKTT